MGLFGLLRLMFGAFIRCIVNIEKPLVSRNPSVTLGLVSLLHITRRSAVNGQVDGEGTRDLSTAL